MELFQSLHVLSVSSTAKWVCEKFEVTWKPKVVSDTKSRGGWVSDPPCDFRNSQE